MERLVDVDTKTVLDKSKKILLADGHIPDDCPKEGCLSLQKVCILDNEFTRIFIKADPPKGNPTNNVELYSVHEACKRCGIEGNDRRIFLITQDEMGTINSESGWMVNLRS